MVVKVQLHTLLEEVVVEVELEVQDHLDRLLQMVDLECLIQLTHVEHLSQ